MVFDHPYEWILVTSVIVGPLTVVIVGSQSVEDARSIRSWSLFVLVLMLLISGARFAVSVDSGVANGRLGMVVFFAGLIASVIIGCRVAVLRDRALHLSLQNKKTKLPLWDDEIA